MVQINGKAVEADGKNLLTYIEETGYIAAHVAIERNLEIIPQEHWGDITIKDGDTIEILQFMGGGA